MNASSSSRRSSADETAALWAARLDGSELSTSHRAELDAWLAADPSHRAMLSSYCQFSADIEQPLIALVQSGSVEMPAFSAPSKPSRWKLFAGSAIIAMAAAIMFAVWITQPKTEFNQIATSVAQRQTVTLSDGTRVDLNAHTRIEVALTSSERRVRLAAGEAYFAVHKDASRPFIIETPAGSVRVTGTSFNVRTENDASLEVIVVEGSVQVRTDQGGALSSSPVLLQPGDRLSRETGGVSVKPLPAAALDDALAWRTGQIVFDGVPLQEALARFGHYHGRSMTVTGSAAQLMVGGRYSLDDPQGFFTDLEQLFAVRISSGLDGSVRVDPRQER